MKLRFPHPGLDAPWWKRLLYLALFPILLGVTVALTLNHLLGEPLSILVIVAVAIPWAWREQRWMKRQMREIEASMAELERLRLEAEHGDRHG